MNARLNQTTATARITLPLLIMLALFLTTALLLSGCDYSSQWTNQYDPYSWYSAARVASTYTDDALDIEVSGLSVLPSGAVSLTAGTNAGMRVVRQYRPDAATWAESILPSEGSAPVDGPDTAFDTIFGGIELGADGLWYCLSYDKLYRRNSGSGEAEQVAEFQSEIIDYAVAADGTVYISVPLDRKIYRWTSGGGLQTFAGTGIEGAAGDGDSEQAQEANLCGPGHLALNAEDGSLYFEDYEGYELDPNGGDTWFGHSLLRRIDTTGILTTVAFAGDKEIGWSETEGLPALEAKQIDGLCFDVLLVAPGGWIILAQDSFVYTISPDGSLYTIAGRSDPQSYFGPEDWDRDTWPLAAEINFRVSKVPYNGGWFSYGAVDPDTGTVYLVHRLSGNKETCRILALERRPSHP